MIRFAGAVSLQNPEPVLTEESATTEPLVLYGSR